MDPATGEVPLFHQQLEAPAAAPTGLPPDLPSARAYPAPPGPADSFAEPGAPPAPALPALSQPGRAFAPVQDPTVAPMPPDDRPAPGYLPPGPPPGPMAPSGLPTAATATLDRPAPSPYGDGPDETEPPVETETPARVPRLPFIPGLEGLRALALLAVLAFAGGVTQVQGGFLGISTAFTLTGFLLTTFALAEWADQGRLSLPALWARRATRIVPPEYFVIALVIVLQLTVRVGSVPTFRTDIWGALGFVGNWQLAFPVDGFARSFQDLSAVRHLWPIAVAVQLTLVLSALFAAIMAVTSRKWHTATAFFALLGVASFAVAWVMSGNPEAADIVYYGTHTRAGEVLVGMVLAYLVMTPSFRAVIRRQQVMSVIRAGGVVALAALAGLWLLLPVDSPLLFRGGTIINALLTGWVILAVTMPGPLAGALGNVALRKLGEISFCAYLLHWPVFLLLDADRTSVDGPALFAVRLVATLAAGFAVAWAVEATFRWRLNLPPVQLVAGLGLVAAIMAVSVAILPVNPPANISLTVDDGTGPGELDVVSPTGEEAARVLVIGDEVAAGIVPGFAGWNDRNPNAQVRVDTHVAADCPLGGPGNVRRFDQRAETTLECEAWRFRLPKMLEAADYDAVVLLMGTADLGEREVRRDWRSLGDPTFDRWMSDQIVALADLVEGADAPVLWATLPHVRMVPEDADPPEPGEPEGWARYDDNDPQRTDRLNVLIRNAIGRRSGFEVADLTAWLQNQPRGEFNPGVRNGSEFTEEGAELVVAWLAPQVLEAAGVAPPADADDES